MVSKVITLNFNLKYVILHQYFELIQFLVLTVFIITYKM